MDKQNNLKSNQVSKKDIENVSGGADSSTDIDYFFRINNNPSDKPIGIPKRKKEGTTRHVNRKRLY